MYKGLYIDDDYDKLELLSELLTNKAELKIYTDTRLAIANLEKNNYDFIVVDINMPIMNGIEFIKYLQDNNLVSNALIFILSSVQDDETKVAGLNLQVNDYLSFDMCPKEIELRIMNHLEKKSQSKLYFNGATISYTKQTLEYKEQVLKLTPIEFKIIHALFNSSGQLSSYEDVQTQIWDDTHVSRQTINTHLSNLKNKITSLDIEIERTAQRGITLKLC